MNMVPSGWQQLLWVQHWCSYLCGLLNPPVLHVPERGLEPCAGYVKPQGGPVLVGGVPASLFGTRPHSGYL
jgi:hypothetical protein